MKNKKIFILIVVIILGFEIATIFLRRNKSNTKAETDNTISNKVENIINNNIGNTPNTTNNIENEISNTNNTIIREESKNEISLFETNTTSIVSEEAFENGHLKKYPEYRSTICKFIY